MATHRIAVGELPSHNHSASTNTTGEHSHRVYADQISSVGGDANSISCNNGISQYTTKGLTTSSGNHAHIVTINNTGSNIAHNNMMPYIAIFIWKRVS